MSNFIVYENIPNAAALKSILRDIIKVLEEKADAWPHEVQSLKERIEAIPETQPAKFF